MVTGVCEFFQPLQPTVCRLLCPCFLSTTISPILLDRSSSRHYTKTYGPLLSASGHMSPSPISLKPPKNWTVASLRGSNRHRRWCPGPFHWWSPSKIWHHLCYGEALPEWPPGSQRPPRSARCDCNSPSQCALKALSQNQMTTILLKYWYTLYLIFIDEIGDW